MQKDGLNLPITLKKLGTYLVKKQMPSDQAPAKAPT